jgi:hypothetical protein
MAKKKSVKSRGQKTTPSKRKRGAGARAQARSAGGKRKTAGARTPKGKAKRKQASNPPRRGKVKKAAGRKTAKASVRPTAKRSARTGSAGRGGSRSSAKKTAQRRPVKRTPPREGGTGRESELDQTPETGRSVRGRTNPMPTIRSTGTPAGAGSTRQAPGLDRARKQLREVEETVQGPPSSLDPDRRASSAAASGRRKLQHSVAEHTETSPVMTGGDVDADWEDAYAVGDEAPGGDNPTPDQDRVDDIGKALGVEYEDNEELKASDKIAERDRHRWELDPASSDDYKDRD